MAILNKEFDINQRYSTPILDDKEDMKTIVTSQQNI